jgi:hypothetical protein
MQLHISIDGTSTAGELRALADMAETLAADREAGTFIDAMKVDTPQQAADPAETVTRKARRTRAQIAADEAATKAQGESKPAAGGNSDPEEAPPEPAAQPIDTDTTAVEPTVATVTHDAATGGKTYTEADVQALATVVARAKGPDVVKDKIAELGGARIADLDAEKLNSLGAFLETQK